MSSLTFQDLRVHYLVNCPKGLDIKSRSSQRLIHYKFGEWLTPILNAVRDQDTDQGDDGPGWGSHSRLFQGSLLPILLTSGALGDPVLFDTVVQHWLLAVDRDRIAVGLLYESPPVCITYYSAVCMALFLTKQYYSIERNKQ